MKYIFILLCFLFSYNLSYSVGNNEAEDIQKVHIDYSFLEQKSFLSISVDLKKIYIPNEFSKDIQFYDTQFNNLIQNIDLKEIYIKEISKEIFKGDLKNLFSLEIFHSNQKDNKLDLELGISLLFLSNNSEKIDLREKINLYLKDPKKQYIYLQIEKSRLLKSFLAKNLELKNIQNEMLKLIKTSSFSISNHIFNKDIR